jgi:hypothetical protein
MEIPLAVFQSLQAERLPSSGSEFSYKYANNYMCMHMHLCAQLDEYTHVTSWNGRLGELPLQQ